MRRGREVRVASPLRVWPAVVAALLVASVVAERVPVSGWCQLALWWLFAIVALGVISVSLFPTSENYSAGHEQAANSEGPARPGAHSCRGSGIG